MRTFCCFSSPQFYDMEGEEGIKNSEEQEAKTLGEFILSAEIYEKGCQCDTL